jgi:predicted N-acyltransferase
MQARILHSLDRLSADTWNALAGDDNPFLRHEFLAALEHSGCTTAASGWAPHHLLIESADAGQRRLQAAVPLYLKTNSYGEYVFDWAWADAYARNGLAYYPKLVAAIPFSPVTGSRILTGASVHTARIEEAAIEAGLSLAKELSLSSLHWLFTPLAQTEKLEGHGLLRRVGYQFHWHNQGYTDFNHFLAGFASHKRKKIRHERRLVADAGVSLEVRSGTELTPALWDVFYDFYHVTIRKHGAIPYLTRAFFHELGRVMPENIVMIFAYHHSRPVAAALNLRGSTTLYGRYWGGEDGFSGLHFETCYYRAIDYCIQHGLQRFEAGAQGEHKLARGFLPVATYSAHWLSHPQFYQAVAAYLQRERNGVESYMSELNEHSPFKKPG